MTYVKKYGLPFLAIVLSISILVYIYMIILTPLLEKEAQLIENKESLSIQVIGLRNIRNQREQYQAEMLMFKNTLDRYSFYADEYGSYDNIILFIRDIERRAGVNLSQIELSGQSLNFEMEANYHGAKIFLAALENIEFLYSANRVLLRTTGDRFVPRIAADFDSEHNLRVSINANFHLDYIVQTRNIIQELIEEIGVRNAYILEWVARGSLF